MKKSDLRREYYKETGNTSVLNSQGEPDFDYVWWLEDKIIKSQKQ